MNNSFSNLKFLCSLYCDLPYFGEPEDAGIYDYALFNLADSIDRHQWSQMTDDEKSSIIEGLDSVIELFKPK